MFRAFIFIILVCLNSVVLAENEPADAFTHTIHIQLTGQLTGASYERHSVIKDDEDKNFNVEVNHDFSDFEHLADLKISGIGEGEVTTLIQFTKSPKQTCTITISDDTNDALPTAKLEESCPAYWKITSLTGANGEFELVVHGEKR